MSEQLKAIRAQIALVDKQIEPLRVELDKLISYRNNLYRHRHLEIHGVKEGVLVKDSKGRVFEVARIEQHSLPEENKPWLTGRLRKKDGTFSAKGFNIFRDWTTI